MMTLSAPSGVTNIGGAKVYAAKLATSKTGELERQRKVIGMARLTFTQYHWEVGRLFSGCRINAAM